MKKVQTIETTVCDVCGNEADGEFFSTAHVNGQVVAERYCPHDFCREHMGEWYSLCDHQAYERYDGRPTEERRAEMLNDFIRLMDE